MTKILIFILLCCCTFVHTQSIQNEVNQFTLNLQRQICESGKNCVISGYSIFNAVGLAYAGAQGQTRVQIQEMLGFNDLQFEQVNDLFEDTFQSVNSNVSADLALLSANRFYGDEAVPFLKEYLQTLETYYDADAKNLDFAGDSERSRKKINNWVEKQTNDLINDLLPGGSITSSTISVLVNALYFKGIWDREFEKEKTISEVFTPSSGKPKTVDFMRQTKKNYIVGNIFNDQASFVKLPYKNKEASMYIIVPKLISQGFVTSPATTPDVTTIMHQLQTFYLPEIFERGSDIDIDLYVPKFTIEFSTVLSDTLKNLGMVDAFNPGAANFGGMVNTLGGQNIYISEGYHKTKIIVDEVGTEAAASTAFVITKLSMSRAPEFRVDVPFGFFIVHEPSKVILFSGIIDDPSQS